MTASPLIGLSFAASVRPISTSDDAMAARIDDICAGRNTKQK
jgi:hypothetical protein